MINNTGIRVCILGLGLFSTISFSAGAQNNATPEKKTKKEKQAEKKERINEMIRQEEEGALIYQKQNLFGFKLYSDGWALLYEKGYMKTVNKTNLFSIEFGEKKDRKELKVAKPIDNGFILGNPLIYGKQNNLYFLKLGVGQSYLLGGKGNRNGVAVSALYGGGLSLGFLKPYYVDVTNPQTDRIESIKWRGDGSYTDSLFIDPIAINGGSGVFTGAGESKVKPGLFFKGGLRFDYGRYNELISAIECGFNGEYYFSDMPIMVENPPKKFFLNLFVAIEFGKRK